MSSFQQQVGSRDDLMGRRYEYEDGVVLALDLGAVEGSVDVADGTVIVVTDDDQYEFDLPGSVAATASMNNGIVTVDVQEA
jgi:hypothetical protein